MAFILASSSPRRAALLRREGYEFRIVTTEVEEDAPASLGRRAMCEANARIKTEAVRDLVEQSDVIVGADTLVFLGDEPLGKPHTEEKAWAMLRRLSGRLNTVCTGVSVQCGDIVETFSVESAVQFRELNEAQISDYMEKVDVLDKAGAYAIQSHPELIIERVEGDIDSVVGLPVQLLAQVLARFHVLPLTESPSKIIR